MIAESSTLDGEIWMATRRKPAGRRAPKFLAIDFFCGAGGTTRGLIDAGGYVIAGIDNDITCRDTFVKNNRNATGDRSRVRFLCYDIFPRSEEYSQGQYNQLQRVVGAKIKKLRNEYPSTPLLFAICAPCQPFTTVSKKALTEDRVNKRLRDKDLLTHALKFVRRFRPDYVLSENVRGIQNDNYGGIWQRFQAGLEELGYITGSDVVCASNFGVPQYRKRSILLAAKRGKSHPPLAENRFKRTLTIPLSNPSAKPITVEKAIGFLPPIGAGEQHPTIKNHKTRSLSELNIKRISAAKPGETNHYMEKTEFGDLSLRCHKNVNEKLGMRCFNDVYTRMRGDTPSPTITTKCHSISNGRFGHYDTKQNRGISLKEAALLQSFPMRYTFFPVDGLSQVARMIGNAVPPKLVEYFASYLVGR